MTVSALSDLVSFLFLWSRKILVRRGGDRTVPEQGNCDEWQLDQFPYRTVQWASKHATEHIHTETLIDKSSPWRCPHKPNKTKNCGDAYERSQSLSFFLSSLPLIPLSFFAFNPSLSTVSLMFHISKPIKGHLALEERIQSYLVLGVHQGGLGLYHAVLFVSCVEWFASCQMFVEKLFLIMPQLLNSLWKQIVAAQLTLTNLV